MTKIHFCVKLKAHQQEKKKNKLLIRNDENIYYHWVRNKNKDCLMKIKKGMKMKNLHKIKNNYLTLLIN